MAAPDRLELTTLRLTAECSTNRTGLCWNLVSIFWHSFYFLLIIIKLNDLKKQLMRFTSKSAQNYLLKKVSS